VLGRWESLEDAREEAAGWLLAIAVDHGTGSPVHREAERLWIRTELEVRASLEHADPGNAARILDQAMHLLAHAPGILGRKELTPEDLIGLMSGARAG
jgi:hypothetical protein